MKKSISSIVLFSAIISAEAAHAQSSVSLYGIIDEGLSYTSNSGGHSLYSLQSSVMQSSRWGLRGTEDLGGGVKTIFVLESGYDPSTGKLGQGGLLFGRQAYVGLGNQVGTVTLGRQYDSVVDFLGPLAASNQWAGAIADHAGDIDNFNNTYRTNNSVKFSSVPFAGLRFSALYSFGGIAGDASRNQVFSGGAGYTGGPLTLGIGYLNVRNPNVSFFGNSTSGTASPTTANISSPIYKGFASAHTYQVIGAGGAYTFGKATLGATYSWVAFSSLGDTSSGPIPGSVAAYTGSAHVNNVEVNFKYMLAPTWLIGVAYNYTNVSAVAGKDGAKYNQIDAGIDYFLSKRTDVYMIGVYQKASGINSLGAPAVAAINLATASTSNRQLLGRVGVRHKF
ncbi:porin [Paraburkholderia phymatum]|uniref:Porin n=1 Tax=Paraburkholderia phymatum TaxID=148447 RepID=A0ACC6U8V3_9BURK